MKFGDYSPSLSPSLEQQRDALQKGLGRALQWALSGRLGEKPLLEACLRDQRFDTQVEDSRGDWLWKMVQAVGATERFREQVLRALCDLSDDRSATQFCELARHYAEMGDGRFRTRLYEIVEQKPIDGCSWIGEKEILALDGEAAFLFAAQVRGRLLASRDGEWDDGSLVYLAAEQIGEEHAKRLLATSTDEAINRLREHLRQRQEDAKQRQRRSQKEKMAAIPIQEVLQAAEGASQCFWFRPWGKYADEADLRTVLQHLWSERDPILIAKLVRVFSDRPLPEFEPRIIELCQHHDREVRRQAFAALKSNAHPLVREFALSQLGKGNRDGRVISLFINNYRRGDEWRILEAMELPDDMDELHWLVMDVIEVLEKNSEADCSQLGIIGYASTPCQNCRFNAARLLLNQQVAPAWLTEECRYDSGEDCRELVESPSQNVQDN